MDEFETARQHLAHVTRVMRLVNFKCMQLRHTNDQLLAGLQDLTRLQDLVAEASPAADGDASPDPTSEKGFPT